MVLVLKTSGSNLIRLSSVFLKATIGRLSLNFLDYHIDQNTINSIVRLPFTEFKNLNHFPWIANQSTRRGISKLKTSKYLDIYITTLQ